MDWPKCTKTTIPAGPVLSMPGSAYHKIGTQVGEWLSEVPECQINTSSKQISDSLLSMCTIQCVLNKFISRHQDALVKFKQPLLRIVSDLTLSII